MKENLTLTSVRLQPVFLNNQIDNEYLMPVLFFGKKQFKVNLYFLPEYKKEATNCRADFLELKGKTIEEVRVEHSTIFDKYFKIAGYKATV